MKDKSEVCPGGLSSSRISSSRKHQFLPVPNMHRTREHFAFHLFFIKEKPHGPVQLLVNLEELMCDRERPGNPKPIQMNQVIP